jgi:hypothetical protein
VLALQGVVCGARVGAELHVSFRDVRFGSLSPATAALIGAVPRCVPGLKAWSSLHVGPTSAQYCCRQLCCALPYSGWHNDFGWLTLVG